MGLAVDFKAGPPKTATRTNKLCALIDTLDPEDRKAAITMLEDRSWSGRDTKDVFARWGLDISYSHFDRLRQDRAWE